MSAAASARLVTLLVGWCKSLCLTRDGVMPLRTHATGERNSRDSKPFDLAVSHRVDRVVDPAVLPLGILDLLRSWRGNHLGFVDFGTGGSDPNCPNPLICQAN
ncbi:MAG: hypothetical protein RL745_561 [Actinomycetota bacterium]